MVVDDDSAVTRSLARVLGASCVVVQVPSATEALQRIHAGERFGVIIVDLHMRGMSGVDLHDVLLREVPDQAQRVVLLTGDPSVVERSIPRERVLPKPFAIAELKAIIARLAALP